MIKEQREKLELTQEELAKKLKISKISLMFEL
ncbi:helix-turn-helix domain-containing protein [Clostridium puniceum]